MIDLRRHTLGACVAIAILAGCGGTQATISATGALAQTPANATRSATHAVLVGSARDSAIGGLYVSEYKNRSNAVVLGYPTNNRRDGGPTCSESAPYARSIGVDEKGDLMVPQQGKVTVFQGPGMCGPKLGSFGLERWGGDGVDVASTNAGDGTIAVAALQDGSGAGSVELCSLKGHRCSANLQNPEMDFVVGVAMAKNGDCWAASEQGPSRGYKVVLTYFARCSGSGQTATHYKNPDTGGLDIDKSGNIVSISHSTPAVYIYLGCKPACKLIGGPFQLKGTAMYGHLNEDSTRFATADGQYNQVDVYTYSPTAVTYRYSFNNGISSSSGIVGVAYNPRSK
jgi:hypothetical protein